MHHLGRTLAAVATLVVAACGAASATEPVDSGIRGVAMVGPTCPVETDPPDPACADRPLANAAVRAQKGGKVVRETRTDARGRFRLRLPPGRYRIYTSGGIAGLSTPVANARVVPHRFTRLNLQVDSGIR